MTEASTLARHGEGAEGKRTLVSSHLRVHMSD